jgi:hypothetical protein
MVELGLAIVLATDFNPGSSPVPSMPFMLSLACLQMGLTPAEALTAATINAAHSLGLGNREIGSLEPGKQADLLIHEFATIASWPTSSQRRHAPARLGALARFLAALNLLTPSQTNPNIALILTATRKSAAREWSTSSQQSACASVPPS